MELLDKNCLDGIRVMPSPPLMVNSVMNVFVKLLQSEKKLPEDISVPLVSRLIYFPYNVQDVLKMLKIRFIVAINHIILCSNPLKLKWYFCIDPSP